MGQSSDHVTTVYLSQHVHWYVVHHLVSCSSLTETGVVVENFSYVFQTSGEAQSITRDEMRSFKKVWAEYANPKTGYLERNRFVAFFAVRFGCWVIRAVVTTSIFQELRGVFEVRIYPVEYSVRNILAAVTTTDSPDPTRPSRIVDGVNVDKLRAVVGSLDYSAIRKRRMTYSRLYYEAIVTHQPGRGMSFTDMLTLLAHHKIIVDREALVSVYFYFPPQTTSLTFL